MALVSAFRDAVALASAFTRTATAAARLQQPPPPLPLSPSESRYRQIQPTSPPLQARALWVSSTCHWRDTAADAILATINLLRMSACARLPLTESTSRIPLTASGPNHEANLLEIIRKQGRELAAPAMIGEQKRPPTFMPRITPNGSLFSVLWVRQDAPRSVF